MENTPNEAFVQHPGKVLEATGAFKHIMAIALDPSSTYSRGIARCIVSRDGDVSKHGYIDRSQIHLIQGSFPDHFEIGKELHIESGEKIIPFLGKDGYEFIGLEDPDIYIDPDSGLTHVYFTMPYINRAEDSALIHLGHAAGKDLNSLIMTEPVLRETSKTSSAKELSMAPINSKGARLNLFESSKREKDFHYSVVQVAIAKDMSSPWEFGEVIFHPKEHKIPWIGGHASPGPLLPKSFIDIGENKLVGIMNGRGVNRRIDGDIKYGMFSVGLFIYDYENGKIGWVSPEPFIQDTEATTITFASQFIETKPGEGILYAHVDDSFVRAYTLKVEGIQKILEHR